VSVGDRIIFGRFSGSEIRDDTGDFLIMREDDVLGIVSVTADAGKKPN
jgi:chaperonin GroES